VTKELRQMHTMSVFTPVHKHDLSPEQKKKAVSLTYVPKREAR
jgi:hypothetical protein